MKTLPKIENMTKGQALNFSTEFVNILEGYIQKVESSNLNFFKKTFEIIKFDFAKQNIQSRIEDAKIDKNFAPLLDILPSMLDSYKTLNEKLNMLNLQKYDADKKNAISNKSTAIVNNNKMQNNKVYNYDNVDETASEKEKLETSFYRKMLEWIGWTKAREKAGAIKESISNIKAQSDSKKGGVIANAYKSTSALIKSMLDNILDAPQILSGFISKGIGKFIDGFMKFLDYAVLLTLVGLKSGAKMIGSGILALFRVGLKGIKALSLGGIISLTLLSDSVRGFVVSIFKGIFGEGAVTDFVDKFLASSELSAALAGGSTGALIGTMIGGPIGTVVGGILGAIGGILLDWYSDGKLDEKLQGMKQTLVYAWEGVIKWTINLKDSIVNYIADLFKPVVDAIDYLKKIKDDSIKFISEKIDAVTNAIQNIITTISDFFKSVSEKIGAAKDFIYDNTIGWFTKKNKDSTSPTPELMDFSNPDNAIKIKPLNQLDVVKPQIPQIEMKRMNIENTIEQRKMIEKMQEISIINAPNNIRNSTNIQTNNKSEISIRSQPVDVSIGIGRPW